MEHRRLGVHFNFCDPEPVRGPPEIVTDLHSFPEIGRLLDLAQEKDQVVRKLDFPAALGAHHSHVVAGEDLADDPVMKEVFGPIGLRTFFGHDFSLSQTFLPALRV
jgi:hypothetical protein